MVMVFPRVGDHALHWLKPVMPEKYLGRAYYLDGILKENLDGIKKAVTQKDIDFLAITDGKEGSGKSTLTIQCAFYLDPSLNLDRITFTPEEFSRAIKNAGKFEAVVFDEAIVGLASRGAMGRVNRVLVSMLAQIRQKNLFVFVVLPSYFDLDKNIALHRSRVLLHTYFKENFEKGQFMIYNDHLKNALYITGKKYYSYNKTRPAFIGQFTSQLPPGIDEVQYRKKKLDALERSCRKAAKDAEESDVVQGLLQKELLKVLAAGLKTVKEV